MAMAPVMSLRPEVAKLNSSSGSVTTRPPPTISVRIYWLHDTRNANRPPTITPGRIAGRVTCRNVRRAEAPRLRACCSYSGSKLAKMPAITSVM